MFGTSLFTAFGGGDAEAAASQRRGQADLPYAAGPSSGFSHFSPQAMFAQQEQMMHQMMRAASEGSFGQTAFFSGFAVPDRPYPPQVRHGQYLPVLWIDSEHFRLNCPSHRGASQAARDWQVWAGRVSGCLGRGAIYSLAVIWSSSSGQNFLQACSEPYLWTLAA